MELSEPEEIKGAIEGLSDAEKTEFFPKILPEICDESLAEEGHRIIFERKLSGSGYLECFDELYEMQKKY